jgi:hypothetical protein
VRAAPTSRRAIAVGVLLLAVGLAGCGEDDIPAAATAPDAVTDEVNAACREQKAAYDERPDFPVEGFDPERPNPEQLPAVAEYFEGNNVIYEDFLARLDGIEPPPEQREAFDAFVEASRAEFGNARDQQEAARARDVDGFVATLPDVLALQERLNETARALGADDCTWE